MEQVDLPGSRPEEIKLIKEFLEFLKARAAKPHAAGEDIEYRDWPLELKGEVTRKEIYDYL